MPFELTAIKSPIFFVGDSSSLSGNIVRMSPPDNNGVNLGHAATLERHFIRNGALDETRPGEKGGAAAGAAPIRSIFKFLLGVIALLSQEGYFVDYCTAGEVVAH